MYRYDWIEYFKLRALPTATSTRLVQISPIVWALGLTSFLTDISSEMVNSILPVYLVLHLRLSPLQYGAIDGIYNGLSVALASIAAGVLADRWLRRKEIAAAGYGLSAVCKLLMLAAAATWGWIALVVGLDRVGKGIRTAPRDALLSLHTPRSMLGTAFGVHRALDSAGALLGPLVAVALLAYLPGEFASLWVVSAIVAFLGLAALWLFVPPSSAAQDARPPVPEPPSARLTPTFAALTVCGTVLSLFTVSDGFIYLLLQQKTGTEAGLVPLFFVATATAYMAFSVPAGILADRFGRGRVFVAGYAVLGVVYLLLFLPAAIGTGTQLVCLLLLGLYYAGTEGVLMAAASSIVQRHRRATGLAILATCIGLGKLVSSLLFGWLSEVYGSAASIGVFAAALLVVLAGCAVWLRRWRAQHE
jgi:MFS family permease